jgi:hypothetical protein
MSAIRYRLVSEYHPADDSTRWFTERLEGASWCYVSGSIGYSEECGRAIYSTIVAKGHQPVLTVLAESAA